MSFEEYQNQEYQQDQTQTPEVETGVRKPNLMPWKILCLALAIIVALGWVGIIALLILKEEWQLVMIAWLLFYAVGHFGYWYSRRRSSRAFSAQIRQQLIARIRGTEIPPIGEEQGDYPPSYDDLVKSEVPPPAYYAVVHETPKLKRAVQSLPLPWFLKKKTLEQSVVDVTAGAPSECCKAGSPSVIDVEGPSTSSHGGQEVVAGAWRSAGSAVCDIPVGAFHLDDGTEEQAIELPSYESLMREAVQPVLTPIHQALASLPRLPSTKAPKQLETIAEDEQQQTE